MNKTIGIGIVVFVVLFVMGGMWYVASQNQLSTDRMAQEESMMDSKGSKREGYSGAVLAGKITPYIEFNKTDYEKALADGKVVFLEFYANWCPICRAQEPMLFEGFNSLNNPNVVGFRVNYNDSDTDGFEKELAKKLNITYQHTHVILKDSKEVYRSNDDLTKEDFLTTVEHVY